MRVITVCVGTVLLALLVLSRPVSTGHSATVNSAREALNPPGIPFGAVPAAAPAPRATAQSAILDIQIDHHFSDGKISVWVDGELEYSHALHAEAKKRLLVFHSAHGRESRKLSLPAGEHHVRVRAQANANSYDQRKDLSGTFASGSQKTLLISFDGPRKGMRVALK